MSTTAFPYDGFLSDNTKDKAVVCARWRNGCASPG
jgi:hypothetical protein